MRDGAGVDDDGGVIGGARGDVYIVSSRISAGVYAPYDFCVSIWTCPGSLAASTNSRPNPIQATNRCLPVLLLVSIAYQQFLMESPPSDQPQVDLHHFSSFGQVK